MDKQSRKKPFCFKCNECGYAVLMEEMDDPTTSTGCCKGCGGTNWKIFDTETKEIIVS